MLAHFAARTGCGRPLSNQAYSSSTKCVNLSEKEKQTRLRLLFFFGKGGIRTLERVLAVTRFPVVRLRPAQPPFRVTLPLYVGIRFASVEAVS